jgi:type IV secretion system protein TrbC
MRHLISGGCRDGTSVFPSWADDARNTALNYGFVAAITPPLDGERAGERQFNTALPQEVNSMRIQHWIQRVSYATLGIAVMASEAIAAAGGGALPWDPPINTIQTDMTGTVAHGVTAAAVVCAGLGWAHSEHGSGMRKASAVGFGGAVSLGALQLMNTLFGAGALI